MKHLCELYDENEPNEKCGFLLDDGTLIELPNIYPEPTQGFEIDPKLVMDHLDRLAGIWHTHPGSTSVLSGEDKLCIQQWPTLEHYVIGQDGVRKYLVDKGIVIHADYLPR